jgi:hypothetical protein
MSLLKVNTNSLVPFSMEYPGCTTPLTELSNVPLNEEKHKRTHDNNLEK